MSRQLRWIVGSTVACSMAAVALFAYLVDARREEPESISEHPESPTVEEKAESPALPEPELAEDSLEAVIESLVPATLEIPEESPAPSDPEPADSPAIQMQAPPKPESVQSSETQRPALPAVPVTKPQTITPPSQAFLDLWKRVPEFDNRLMAMLASWQSGPSPLERRRGVERLECSIHSVCVSSEQRWESVITNLGVGGAELLHPDYVSLDTRLALVPKTHQSPVTGRVAWVLPEEEQYRIGLCFDSEPEELSQSWVAEILLELGSSFLLKRAPRRYVRVPTDVPSCLMTDDGRQIEVVLKDVSLGGCLLQSSEPFQVEEITLRLGSVDCRGMVVNHRECPDTGWSHHVHFAPLGPFETLKLIRTISVLLKNGT